MLKILADELEAKERSTTPYTKDSDHRLSDTTTTAAFVSGDRRAMSGC